MENKNGNVFLEINPLQTESELLIKSENKPASLKLNNENIKFDWNKDKGLIETGLKEGTKAKIEIIY